MKCMARGLLCLLIVSALLTSSACKRGGQEKAAVKTPKLKQPVQVPETVLAYIAVKNPERTLEHLLAIGNSFLPIPFERAALMSLFAQRAGIPSGVMAAIDTAGVFWLVVLDGEKIAEADPGVVILPIRSKQGFERALAQVMEKSGEDGGLEIYKPKGDTPGLLPVRLKIQEKVVIVATSKAALERVDPFIARNLIGHQPSHDITVHLMMEHLERGPGKDLDQKVTGAMKKLRSLAPAQGPIDQRLVAGAAEESLQQYIDQIKSLRDLMVTVDMGPKEISLALRGEGKPGSELQKIVKRQRAGKPFGYKLLPASSWLVLTNLSNPQSKAEWLKIWDTKMLKIFKELDPRDRPLLHQALTTLSTNITGDISAALHRGIEGKGVAGSMTARVSDAAGTGAALARIAGLVDKWAQKQLSPDGSTTPRDWTFTQRKVSLAGAEGVVMEAQISMPTKNRSRITLLMGDTFRLGWVLKGEYALFAVGNDVERQLRQMAQGLKSGGSITKSLGDNPAFVHALGGAPDRVGMLYFSLVDLGRWLQGSGIGEIEAIAAALKGAQVRRAPSVDWGVNRARSHFDVTLRLPIEHFEAFKPILDEFLKRGGPIGIFP